MGAEFPDWFSAYAKPNFEKYLIPLAGVDNLHFLQLGVYTGDASVWLLDNILTGKDCTLTDVDTWQGSDEEVHQDLNFGDVYCLYLDRVGGNTKWHRETTQNYLVHTVYKTNVYHNYTKPEFDFIYIDADHTAAGVLLDGELSWPLLKSGGIMAFDDYQWGQHLPVFKTPKLGIDMFLNRHIWEYEVLEHGLQVWIRKL